MKPTHYNLSLAVLLATAFTLPVQASDVTIYGVGDVGVSVSQLGNGRNINVNSGAEDGSRIGFKGSEDLGAGFKAIFTVNSKLTQTCSLYKNMSIFQ